MTTDWNTCKPDSTTSSNDAAYSHGPRQMVFACDQEQMMHPILLKFIHQRREISERVLRSVIQANPVLCETSIKDQVLGVFRIGPPAYDQWQVHPACQMQTHALTISIASENQNPLGLMIRESSFHEGAQGTSNSGSSQNGRTEKQRAST
tara:strand:- start:2181 stop:2630 length:450 start_codon:yes stop_codon:yes gene_type:complete